MLDIKIKYTVVFLLLFSSPLVAQERESEVRETVTVVKSYNPEIEPSKKKALVPKKPKFNKNSIGKLSYKIPTFPVLETHIPKFAAPYLHWVTPVESDYSTILNLSAGNYANLNVDLNHHQYVSSFFNYGFKASYNHLKGDLNNYVFSPFNENIYLGSVFDFSTAKGQGNVNLSYETQSFNYYGLELMLGLDPVDKSVEQTYKRATVDTEYKFYNGVIDHISIDLNTISDITDSNELNFVFGALSKFELANNQVRLASRLDYIDGGFQNASLSEKVNIVPDPYKFMELEFKPQLEYTKDKLAVLVGVDINYLSQKNSTDESEINIYPAIDAKYTLSREVDLKGSLNGNTQLNSFGELTQLNPYLSPTIDIKPSFTLFDLDFGIEANSGKFLSFKLDASYSRVKNKPLMMLNYQNYFRDDSGPYLNNNLKSFQIVYDQIDQASIGGALTIRPVDHISINSGIRFNKYKTLNEKEAWNLPNLTAFGSINAKLSDRWMFHSQLHYIGARKDRNVSVVEFIMPGEYPEVMYDLDAFVNLDVSLNYQYSDNWSFELKAENLTNNQYQLWYDYSDLGAKISIGAQYRFDL